MALGVNCFEHFAYILSLGFGHNRKHVPVEVNDATLVFGLREHFSHRFQHPQALVSHDELYTC